MLTHKHSQLPKPTIHAALLDTHVTIYFPSFKFTFIKITNDYISNICFVILVSN